MTISWQQAGLALISLAIAPVASSNPFYASTLDLTQATQDVIDDRLSMAGPLFNELERVSPEGSNLWVTAEYAFNKDRHFSGNNGYKINTGGGWLGYDHVLFQDFRLGFSINGGGGDIKNEGGRDLNFRMGWWGASVYATWTGKKVNVIANVGYLHSYSHSKLDAFGKEQDQAITAGMKFETSFMVGPINFVPYYGFRYTHLQTNGIHTSGGLVDWRPANIWHFPVGVNMGYQFEFGGWRTRTMLDLAIIPEAGERNVEYRNANTFDFSPRYAAPIYYRGKIGIELSNGHHGIGVLYKTGFGPHGKYDQAVALNYQFMF
ncbi:MAG: autotransporter outer membrane beta-barrel domain-containing protein [Burkholderiales bacterium]|nr:autotransporter outer membrane beta-barrel domain-containing protein [Burkholderiales bacterium]